MRIAPQPGPQTAAAKCKADVLVYGGSAGGGKSFFQSYRAAKYHKVPGYNAVLFRRTFPMLQGSGSLWDECMGFYPALGATWTTRPLEFTWDSPARVEFRHLLREETAQEHKSKQYGCIGFDEASDFTGRQFTFMLSRLRTTAKVRKQFILTTNPDPDCYLRKWISWWIGDDGFPRPERSGIVRYFVRVKDEIVWGDTREELVKYVDDPEHVMSFTFIGATVYDNKILLEKDPSYLGKLKSLPEVERARFLGGNWDVKESAGDMFQQGWFRIWYESELERELMNQNGPGARIVQRVRWWDFAATPVKGDLVPGVQRPADFKAREPGSADPDWSMGWLLGRTADRRTIILDVKAYRDTPGAIEFAVERTAQEDGPAVTVGWWQDPGQAAIAQSERLQARISKHANVICTPASKSKMEYAREPSRAAYRGELLYARGPWNALAFNQLQQFPSKDAHDDGVDALSGGWQYLEQNPGWEAFDAPGVAPLIARPDEVDFWYPPTPEKDNIRRNLAPVHNKFGRRLL